MLCLTVTAGRAQDPRQAQEPRKQEPRGWDVRLDREGEPGEPFELSGVVQDANGKPLANAKLFFYQADAKGQYARPGQNTLTLGATLRTDAKGRYRLRSVFPGGYGGMTPHVHYEYLQPKLGANEVQVRREGEDEGERGLAVPRGKDGVWRLTVTLTPSGPGRVGSATSAAPRTSADGSSAARESFTEVRGCAAPTAL
jgi:hypothetical protein